MQIEVVTTQMIILCLVVLSGFIAGKCSLMTEDFSRKLSGLVINMTCPCLIIASTMGDTIPDRSYILPLLMVGFVTYAVLLAVAYIVPRFLPVALSDRGLYSFMITFGNVAFIGYPVIASIFGHEAIFYASVLNVPNTLAVFTFGEHFIAADSSKVTFNYSRLVSPAMISTYISILIVALGIKVPLVVSEPLRLVGNITVPAALLIIGCSMSLMPLKRMRGSLAVYVVGLFRLVIMPFTVYFVLKLLCFDDTLCAIDAILISTPVASFGTMFCLKMGRDDKEMTAATFITTIISIITIPVVAFLIEHL